ncbi:hypothetical protein SEA_PHRAPPUCCINO_66 [Mycobacterium phage Phrappuccino]|uniref:Uncharacterized protein n=1 Tax=Mycobacterium phage Phrappuccino TaxID=2591223 RepID=A0A514DDP9_9CAUD|nr:hypothetical protein KHQ87_gp066 [Mycobacterium phage Phrappuccino]QDH91741.1 hypothetical protein SEA_PHRAPPUCCINO_66 [Mycobacterium phage Phrappuccino]QIQ63184.1 hypothetical protein SEA_SETTECANDELA_66 [Mycobacterium phage Settecandela]
MTSEPSGIMISSPKIRDQALVRKFVSQGGRGYIALDIRTPEGSVDPDEGSLQLKVWFNDVTAQVPVSDDPRGVLALEVSHDELHREDTGKYDYEIGPALTSQRGVFTVEWLYKVGGTEFSFTDHLQVLSQMPLYDTLSTAERLTVEQVSWMLGDLFDSTEGGPYLIEQFQTHFDYERIAQLAQIAVTRLNTTGFPVTYWAFGGDGGGNVVPKEFAGLHVLATYYEVVRHLIRSYVEIPARVGANITFLDRRDYMQRWQSILATELPEWQKMVKTAKRSLLGLGRGALLVSGGIYGSGATGVFQYGMYVSHTRAFRFYPAAPAVSWGSIGR